MLFFKKNPKPDVMGYICYLTTLKRCENLIQELNDQEIFYPSYLYSTSIIINNLKVKYSDKLIGKVENQIDKFLIKQYKEYANVDILQDRKRVMNSIKENRVVEDFLNEIKHHDEVGIVEITIHEWMNAQLLLDENIRNK